MTGEKLAGWRAVARMGIPNPDAGCQDILRKLPKDRWSVLNRLPIGSGGAMLDHLLVGTPGVFVLLAKDLGGRVNVSGKALWTTDRRRTELIPEVLAHTLSTRTRLSEAMGERVSVGAIIALGCRTLQVESTPPGIVVLRKRDLVRWLSSLAPVIPMTTAARILEVARQNSTWA
jgi:hypothetical protein